jgi:hypothetical protein
MPIRTWQPSENDDLSEVIKRIAGVKRATRVRLANDAKTRALLAAGMRLLDAQFAAADSDEDESRRYPFFQWLSRKKIAEEVVAADETVAPEDRDAAIAATSKLMERRWPPHDHFIQDFLNYAIAARHWSLHVALSEDARDLLIRGLRTGDFPAAVHEVAFEDLRIPVEVPGTQRMQLLASVLADREPEFGDVVREQYESVDRSWTALYEELFAERGWKLRPGLTFQDLNLMLSTAAEGMALRALTDATGIIDLQARTSLLGTLALALTISCVDPGDGMSLEEVARVFTPPDGDDSPSAGGPER